VFPTTYQTDGTTTVFTFDWPYLDRSHVFVTVNDAPRSFSFIDDHTLKIVDLFGNPFPEGLPLKIYRVTPDLVSYAAFKDAANLTADDLNRARLQVLFLVQERSGGIAGYIGQAIQNVTNEIDTISGALDTLAETQGILQAGLGTLEGLNSRIEKIENGAQALQDQINQEIQNRSEADSSLSQRIDSLEVDTANYKAQFNSQITLLSSEQEALAALTQSLSARVDNIDTGGDDDGNPGDDTDDLAASIINSAVASVKQDFSLGGKISAVAQQIETLEADLNDNVKAMIQVEQQARVDADEALATQITTLQSEVGDNLSQVVEEIKADITSVDGKVTGLESQWTLKAQVTRADGTVVMGGIGLAATANDDYVGSKLALMADAVLFVDPNTPDGELVPFLESGLVDGSPTLVIPSHNVGDKTLPGRVLVDGSIDARAIAANSITGDRLTAGSITTDKVAVGLGANLLNASEFVDMTGAQPSHWYVGYTGNVPPANVAFTRDLAGWALLGGHTACLYLTWTNGDANIGSTNCFIYSDPIPVVAGSKYEFSAYVGAHRAPADIGVFWYDTNQAGIGASGFTGTAGCSLAKDSWFGGPSLPGYFRMGAIGKAPANAAMARLVIRKGAHVAPATDSYLFITQPMFAQTTDNATQLSPYTRGGLSTLITPGGITTPSLSALSATIGLLRTAGSGARMELESNQLRVYDANNVLRVRLGVW
jgi:chaperonin cofactor prefoldin